jgi:Zn finger protein HypA/HybF involved in hydrogenase expression
VAGKPTNDAAACAASLVLVRSGRRRALALEGFLLVLILIGLICVGYYFSLRRNPWVTCRRCHGKPRKQGWLFSHAHHTCPRCQGTGQQIRLGRRLLDMGPDKPPW